MSTEQTIQIGEQKLKIKRRDAKLENAVMNCEKIEKVLPHCLPLYVW